MISTRRLLHALALPFLAIAFDHPIPALAAEIDPIPLKVDRNDKGIAVEGGHFGLTWTLSAGGDLTSIRLHDGVAWHELVGKGTRRTSVPGLLIYTAGGTLGPFAAGTATVVEESPERVIVATHSRLATEAGALSAVEIRQTYTVYREGAVFVDLELELPSGSPALNVQEASIGWAVDTSTATLNFWHWQSSPLRGSGFLTAQPKFSAPFTPNVGLALGTAGQISNQLQLVIESDDSFGGSTDPISTSVKDGQHFSFWLRSSQSGPVVLSAPYRYRNRWGFLLGRSPARSRLAGHRIGYWTEEEGTGMAFPPPGAIDALARCGASALILGEGWLRTLAGRDFLERGPEPRLALEPRRAPEPPPALREFIASAHEAGLRCLATAAAGGEGEAHGEALGRSARAAGLDGLYLTRASAHYRSVPDPEGSGIDYPARATFAWGQALRRGLGPDGIIIIHTGLEAPDLTLGLLADGVAFGTERAEWRAGRSTLATGYLGGGGYATPCPLGLAPGMRTPRVAAVAAAIGAALIVPVGEGEKRSAYEGARWALPLWQLLRLTDPGGALDFRPPGVRSVVSASNASFWSTTYRLSEDLALLVAANLSLAERDSTAIALDLAALGFAGEYEVEVLTADSPEGYAVRHAGRTTTGRFRTDAIPSFGLRGYLFSRGERAPSIAQSLDQGLQVARAFSDGRPPDPPADPEVKPVSAGLELTWSRAADDQHVARYRVYRSADPKFGQPKESLARGEAHEETRYRDLELSPGENWNYVVTALDVAGNESRPSVRVTATVPAGERSFSFSDSAAARRAFIPQAGARWSVHDSAYGNGCIPDRARLARSLVAGIEREDVDLSVKILNATIGAYAGGLVCRATPGPRGGGYLLYLGGPERDELVLARLDGETVEPLARAPYRFAGLLPTTHTLRLVARGAELSGYCDDRLLVTAADRTYARGQVGLVGMEGHVHFDNLTLARVPASGSGAAASPPKADGGTF